MGKELEAEEERCLPPRLLWEVAESDGMDATNRDTNPISNAITHTTLTVTLARLDALSQVTSVYGLKLLGRVHDTHANKFDLGMRHLVGGHA